MGMSSSTSHGSPHSASSCSMKSAQRSANPAMAGYLVAWISQAAWSTVFMTILLGSESSRSSPERPRVPKKRDTWPLQKVMVDHYRISEDAGVRVVEFTKAAHILLICLYILRPLYSFLANLSRARPPFSYGLSDSFSSGL